MILVAPGHLTGRGLKLEAIGPCFGFVSVAPGHLTGRGLKPTERPEVRLSSGVAPGHLTGRGLKPIRLPWTRLRPGVAPGHLTGRGLKRRYHKRLGMEQRRSARSSDRARIETRQSGPEALTESGKSDLRLTWSPWRYTYFSAYFSTTFNFARFGDASK